MTRKQTFIRCIAWYIAALLLAPLLAIAFGEWGPVIPWCVIGLPALPALVFLLGPGRPDSTAIFVAVLVAGYIVQLSLAAIAISTPRPAMHRVCYLIFRCLLVLDVLVAWLGPIIAIMIIAPGE